MVNDRLRPAVLKRRELLVGAAAVALARFERSAMAQPEERKVDIEGLAASYMRPTSEERAPTAVIIAGSGPTDRDGNSTLGLKTDTYKLLAHALAERGVASVRYDKRGVAGSAGIGLPEQQLTIRTFANDAVAVARWADRQAPGAPVALLGHSEGGLLALLAAGPAQAKAVVLLATPGRRLGTILREQFSRPGIPERLSDEAKRIVSSLEKGEPVASVSAELAAAFRPSVQPFLISVMQVDPSRELQAVTAPVLVVGGGRDAQLGRSDFDALAGARPGLATHWEPTMGHTLKPVRDDDPTVALTEGLADRVAAFVRGVSR